MLKRNASTWPAFRRVFTTPPCLNVPGNYGIKTSGDEFDFAHNLIKIHCNVHLEAGALFSELDSGEALWIFIKLCLYVNIFSHTKTINKYYGYYRKKK